VERKCLRKRVRKEWKKACEKWKKTDMALMLFLCSEGCSKYCNHQEGAGPDSELP